MDPIKVRPGYCKNCKLRNTCVEPCEIVKKDLAGYYCPQREIAWSELTDIPIEQAFIETPWSDGYIPDNESWIQLMKKLKLCRIKLTKKQKTYLYLHQIKKMSQEEISTKYGVSQQAVSRSIALAKLKLEKIRG